MENIAYDHPVFSSPAYRRDTEQFFILEAIKPTAKLLISDGESWVAGSSLVPHLAAWVWTADGISPEQLGRLREELHGIFNDEYKPCISAKPEIAEFLAQDYGAPVKSMLMNVYICPSVNKAKEIDGTIRKAAAEDIDAVALFFRNFESECFSNEPMSLEKAHKIATKIIENQTAFIICRDGKPVAMAKSSNSTDKCVSVNGVYTLPQFRKLGYAAALVGFICRLILESGRTPLLYADAANPASNKAYRNVGFISRGQILNLEFGGFHHEIH